MEKQLPADIDAERSTLGALLMDRDAIVAVAPWLLEEYFYLEKHTWIYEAVLECYHQRIPPDVRTISDALRRKERLDAIGGLPYLVELTVATPTAVHIEYYAAIVERTALLRRLIQTGGAIAALGYDECEDLDVVFGAAQEALSEVVNRRLRSSALTATDLADRAFVRWSDETPPAIPTGLIDYDDLAGGLRRKNLTIIAARPSVGKTSWALQVLLNIARKGYKVLFFSLEMSPDEIEDRLASNQSGLPLDAITNRAWSGEEFGQIVRALGELSSLPYVVDSFEASGNISSAGIEGAYTVSALYNRTLQMAYQQGAPDVVIVDFLQLLDAASSQRRTDNRTQEIDRIVRGLKALSMRLNCAVIALSQLSRDVEKRQSHVPILADLRDSGAIEQIADTVIFIHRPILYAIGGRDADGNSVDPRKAELYIAKQRNGPIGMVPVYCDLETGRWQNRAGHMVSDTSSRNGQTQPR